jgi:DNA-binding transcriptional ArsR family regulator
MSIHVTPSCAGLVPGYIGHDHQLTEPTHNTHEGMDLRQRTSEGDHSRVASSSLAVHSTFTCQLVSRSSRWVDPAWIPRSPGSATVRQNTDSQVIERIRTSSNRPELWLQSLQSPTCQSERCPPFDLSLAIWLNSDMASDEASVFRALADPTRRQILQDLRGGELSAGEIASRFPIKGPSVSRHLSILRSAGLLTERRDANRILYSLAEDRLAACVGGFLSAVCPEQVVLRHRRAARAASSR